MLSAGTGERVLFRVSTSTNRQLQRQASRPTSNPNNKVTSNPSKLLITSLPQEDYDAQDPPVASYMDHKTQALALRIAHMH